MTSLKVRDLLCLCELAILLFNLNIAPYIALIVVTHIHGNLFLLTLLLLIVLLLFLTAGLSIPLELAVFIVVLAIRL